MHRPASAHIARGPARQEKFVARAKRTDRTAARRRYRSEQAALAEPTDVVAVETGPAKGKGAAAQAPAQPRPGIVASFKAAYRPLDLRGDLRAAPAVLTHWGVLAAIAITVAASAVFVISTNDFASSIDFSDPNALTGKSLDTVSSISYTVISMLIVPPPMAGAFLIIAAACYAVVLSSPAGKLLTAGQPADMGIASAAALSPVGAALFAAAAAWYRRFLDLANPNRNKARQQQGKAKPRQKAASSSPRR
jgi:hypothetical protein